MPHFAPACMYHSFVPFEMSMRLSYCLVSFFGDVEVAPSMVFVPPGETLTVEVETFLMKISIPF